MNTKEFWENRLAQGIDLRTTGHRAFNISYNQWLYQAQKDRLDLLLAENRVPLNNDTTLLDIGSGWGYFVEYFIDKGVNSIEGIDIAKPSVEYLQQKYPQLAFYQADISANALPTHKNFDLVSAFSVVFHIVDDKKFRQALLNMVELIKPGGYLIICDAFEKKIIPTPWHVRFRTLAAYEEILQPTEMRIIDLLPQYFFMNRTFFPKIGPWIINQFNLGKYIYLLDKKIIDENQAQFWRSEIDAGPKAEIE